MTCSAPAASPDWPQGLARAWHPLALEHELTDRPLAVTLLGRRLALFRSGAELGLVEDRCPHRNVPLSAGRVNSGALECPYHGWQFDPHGQCIKVPGSSTCAVAGVRAWPVRAAHGLIWGNMHAEPAPFPQFWSETDGSGYDRFWWNVPAAPAAIGDAIENLLDPLHSYFLHPGLVRRSRQPQSQAIAFTSDAAGCAASYVEERTGLTLLQRLTEGGRIRSWGRYRAPTMVQIAFDDARGCHLAIDVVFAPLEPGLTRPYARFATRKGVLPAWLKRGLLIAFNLPVLAQDRGMLRLQLDNSQRFGGPDYRSGPLDMFAPAIWAGLNDRPIPVEDRQLRLEG